MKEEFIYTNPNPNGDNIGDCYLRALTLLLKKDFSYIKGDLLKFKQELETEMNEKYDINNGYLLTQYLHSKGYIAFNRWFFNCPVWQLGKKRTTMYKDIVVAVDNHITFMSKGTCYDTSYDVILEDVDMVFIHQSSLTSRDKKDLFLT
ncbi:hypothetical protein [Dysgonomonas sp. 520]|uniref:hypothetical protein n=1 Tax=Dysgonomonas sp. 520 TaxID=2302931 RepID=UPI0013D26C9A|nr:hypothetical protein [Dysgonomonas sp. 520]NDW10681.1 hypothetical protein [Dysgonomonas sp. 520]